MNPCPCGYFGHSNGKCRCTPDSILRYQGKISGPLLDRIDMQILVQALPHEDLFSHTHTEPSHAIQERVEAAYLRQLDRQAKPNNLLSTKEIELHCQTDQATEQLLRSAMLKLNWSARAYHRVLKVARSIADLANSPVVLQTHVAEAIQYRRAMREH